MSESHRELLRIRRCLAFDDAVLVLACTGWMDGGDVSSTIEQNQELAKKVRKLEVEYDNKLLELDADEG